MRRALFPEDTFDLADVVLDVARRDPQRAAVLEPDGRGRDGRRRYRRHTYGELSADVEAVAVGLRTLGIAEHTRTVFMAPPSYQACVVGTALTRVGATTVWIDPAVGYRAMAERLRRVRVEAFVGTPLAHLGRLAFGWGPRRLARAVTIGGWFPGTRSVAALRGAAPATIRQAAVRPGDPATILYTTGSTGPAKPALYRHRELVNVFRLVHHTWRFDPTSGAPPIDMPVFPAFFGVGLSAGGTVVVPPIDYVRQGPADVDARAVLEVIRDCRVQTLFASPVILDNLARAARELAVTAPSLRTVVGGGAPLYASVIAPLRQMLPPGADVHADYGATEALPVSELPGREAVGDAFAATATGAGLCVGAPLPGVEVKIIAIADEAIASFAGARELPPGEIGEIIVHGAHISAAYADDAAATARNKIADHHGRAWHRLGDAGYLDRRGRLWVCGRLGHRVVLATGPLYPLMCEPIFDAHPAVRRSGLVGVPVPVICIELAPGIRPSAQLRDELLLVAAMHPQTRDIRHLLFHPRLPVDPRHNSKIERPALARWAAKQLPREQRRAVLELAPASGAAP